jgi:hypothetical protein
MAQTIEARWRCRMCHRRMADPAELTEWWRRGRAEAIRVCMLKQCRDAAEARGYSTERHGRRPRSVDPGSQ